MRVLPPKAFPLGGRWHGEAVTDEGAMIERFRFLAGRFRRLRAARYFPSDGKVPKGSPGTAQDERFALIFAFPRTPLRGDAYLLGCVKFPARGNLSGWSKFPPAHWGLGQQKLQLVRFHFRAWLCCAGDSRSVVGGPAWDRPLRKKGDSGYAVGAAHWAARFL